MEICFNKDYQTEKWICWCFFLFRMIPQSDLSITSFLTFVYLHFYLENLTVCVIWRACDNLKARVPIKYTHNGLHKNSKSILFSLLSLFSCVERIFYIRSQKKNAQLVYGGFIYNKKQTQANGQTTWRCSEWAKNRCRAVCITINSKLVVARRDHQHDAHWERVESRDVFPTEHDIDAHGEILANPDAPNEPKFMFSLKTVENV